MTDHLHDPFIKNIKAVLGKVRKNNDEKAIHWFHKNAPVIREDITKKLLEIRQKEGLPQKAEQAYKAGHIAHLKRLEEITSPSHRKTGTLDWNQEEIIWAILGSETKSPLYMTYEHLKQDVDTHSRHTRRPH